MATSTRSRWSRSSVWPPRFASPLAALAEIGSAMRMAATELRRITTVLDTPALPEPSTPQPVSVPGRVDLDHVAFSYPGRQVLSDISFTAEPGTMTALVAVGFR
ncbi:MAG TPA: hypothetical protein VFC01_02100 [Mycobacterium sp.]|nr:hypothetical protein [Mycobacterium sp.]